MLPRVAMRKSSGVCSNCVHQSLDRAVQRFIEAAHLVYPADRVQHSSVMPAAELAADFLERRPGELPRQVHCNLTWEDVCPPIATQGEFQVPHLVQCRSARKRVGELTGSLRAPPTGQRPPFLLASIHPRETKTVPWPVGAWRPPLEQPALRP